MISVIEQTNASQIAPPFATKHSGMAEMTLREVVSEIMRRYFEHLDGSQVTNLHQMVIKEVEAPLLASVMQYVQSNQCAASQLLGLNRGTLRKKLKEYDLL